MAVAADIRLATPERVPRIAAMLGRAFVVEPAMLWSYGAHGDVAARFGRIFEIFEESLVESGMLWEAGDALGAAGWIPPDGLDGLDDAFVRIGQ